MFALLRKWILIVMVILVGTVVFDLPQMKVVVTSCNILVCSHWNIVNFSPSLLMMPNTFIEFFYGFRSPSFSQQFFLGSHDQQLYCYVVFL